MVAQDEAAPVDDDVAGDTQPDMDHDLNFDLPMKKKKKKKPKGIQFTGDEETEENGKNQAVDSRSYACFTQFSVMVLKRCDVISELLPFMPISAFRELVPSCAVP